MKDEKDFYYNEIFKEYKERGDIQDVGKNLGKGSYGIVKEVRYKNKHVAGKIIMKETLGELEYSQDLKGPNIVKIYKICSPITKYGNTYHLIIMEKAMLRDLGKLNDFFHKKNLLKLASSDLKFFDEPCSDCIIRYYARHIINGLQILDKNNLAHFDIKPENILITINLIPKLTDFSTLKYVANKEGDEKDVNNKIVGGTRGYISPEYYLEKEVSTDVAKKQDYFSLGCVLFLLKYNIYFLKTMKEDDKSIMNETIINLLMRNDNYLKSQKLADKDFINFITNLISIKPEKRYNLEQIYRHKWINKNLDYISKMYDNFETDEEKLLMEFQKHDFLLQKKAIYEINKKYYNSDNKIKQSENEQKKTFKRNIRKNFRFKKPND